MANILKFFFFFKYSTAISVRWISIVSYVFLIWMKKKMMYSKKHLVPSFLCKIIFMLNVEPLQILCRLRLLPCAILHSVQTAQYIISISIFYMGSRCRHIIDRLAWVSKVPNTIVCRIMYGLRRTGILAWSAYIVWNRERKWYHLLHFPTFSYIHFCIWNMLSTIAHNLNQTELKTKWKRKKKKNKFSNENQMQ